MLKPQCDERKGIKKNLTDIELVALRESYEAGDKINEIAKRFKIGTRRIHEELTKLNVPPRSWPRVSAKHAQLSNDDRDRAIIDYIETTEAPQDIARKYRISLSRLYRELDRAGVARRRPQARIIDRVPEELKETIRSLYASGATLDHIECRSGLNYGLIYAILAQKGTTLRQETYEALHFDPEFADRLRSVYGDGTLSTEQVCSIFGINEVALYNLLDHHKILRRRIAPERNHLNRIYSAKNTSIDEVCGELGMCRESLYYWLKRYNIPLRKQSSNSRKSIHT